MSLEECEAEIAALMRMLKMVKWHGGVRFQSQNLMGDGGVACHAPASHSGSSPPVVTIPAFPAFEPLKIMLTALTYPQLLVNISSHLPVIRVIR